MTVPAIFIRTLNGILDDITAELKTAQQHLAEIEVRLLTPPDPDRHCAMEASRLATLARLKIEMTLRLLNGDG